MNSVITLITTIMVSVYGCGVDSAAAQMQCEWDHECPDGFYCYEESQFCTRCVECFAYKRKSSWRSCPKIPSDCGSCVSGFEEEVLHNGRTRDMCIQASPNSQLQTAVLGNQTERYVWLAALTALLLPIIFYTFCRKGWKRDRGAVHHGLPHEEPPPYRSMEMTNLATSNNSSEERLSEENHELRVDQQKDRLVQAVPFRQSDYIEPELLAFDSIPEGESEMVDSSPRVVVEPQIVVHDEDTMPSNWSPAEINNQELLTLESSEAEDTCEPSRKRHKNSETHESEETGNTLLNINLFINNKVTIHKNS